MLDLDFLRLLRLLMLIGMPIQAHHRHQDVYEDSPQCGPQHEGEDLGGAVLAYAFTA